MKGDPVRPTRQVQGIAHEKAVLKGRGMKRHPMSGGGRIKQDGSDNEQTAELKLANKSYSLKGAELDAALRDATKQGKEATFSIYFEHGDVTLHGVVLRGRQ